MDATMASKRNDWQAPRMRPLASTLDAAAGPGPGGDQMAYAGASNDF